MFQEYDLEQKIEVEIKMREGSARLLAAAKHRAQSLEAARALLTSNERMSVYMTELQSRRRDPIKKPWFVDRFIFAEITGDIRKETQMIWSRFSLR